MLDIIHLLASIPSVLLKAGLSASLMLAFYGTVLLVITAMRRRPKMKLADIETVLIK